MIHWINLLIFAILLLVHAEEPFRSYGEIMRSGQLRVGLTCDYAPYSYKRNDQIIGADVIMAENLAKYLGLKMKIVETTWSNLTNDLIGNKFDIAMGGISINPSRKQFGTFSNALLIDGKRPIVRCEDKEKYRSIEDINKTSVRVIVNPGGTNEKFVNQHLDKVKKILFNDNRYIFKEIAANRADLMITDGAEVDFQSKLNSGVLCPANTLPFDNFQKGYWMHHDQNFVNKVNQWLAKCKSDRLWQQALDRALRLEQYAHH